MVVHEFLTGKMIPKKKKRKERKTLKVESETSWSLEEVIQCSQNTKLGKEKEWLLTDKRTPWGLAGHAKILEVIWGVTRGASESFEAQVLWYGLQLERCVRVMS